MYTFMLHKTPLNSWHTLLKWREKGPILPAPFKCFQGEKGPIQLLEVEEVLWRTLVRYLSSDIGVEEKERACVYSGARTFTPFVFPLDEHRKKTDEQERKYCWKQYKGGTPGSTVLLTFSKWQIIDFFHACKHCISIEMASFCVSNR